MSIIFEIDDALLAELRAFAGMATRADCIELELRTVFGETGDGTEVETCLVSWQGDWVTAGEDEYGEITRIVLTREESLQFFELLDNLPPLNGKIPRGASGAQRLGEWQDDGIPDKEANPPDTRHENLFG